MGNNVNPVLKTLIYSNIFDYPLTFDELRLYLITDSYISAGELKRLLGFAKGKIIKKENYYMLKEANNIVSKRKNRASISKKKMTVAYFAGKLLSVIPSILYIGISGSLALENADEEDDIDFFLITQKNTLWITRFLCLIILEFCHLRRRKFDKNPGNKICINMIIDISSLTMQANRQDLYTAHEIVQLKTVFSRNDTYFHFLQANIWIKQYLANYISEKETPAVSLHHSMLSRILYPLEYFARIVQFYFMKKTLTNETIAHGFVAFHPKDYRKDIGESYWKKLTYYV